MDKGSARCEERCKQQGERARSHIAVAVCLLLVLRASVQREGRVSCLGFWDHEKNAS